MDHPFLQPKQLPDWSQMLPENIETDIHKALHTSQEAIDTISKLLETDADLNYSNTFEAFEKALEPLNIAWGFVNHLDSVNNSKDLRKAFNEMLPKVTQFYTDIPLNPSLWKVLKRYGQNDESVSQLSPTQQRHIEETLADFKEEGADLPETKKEQVRNIQKELAELTQKYSENCLDATNAWEHIVQDATQLEGLPESALQAAKESAQAKGYDNAWRFTLDATSYIPVMSYAKDPTLRKTVWQAYQSIGREAPYDNQDLVEQILNLRHTYAQTIGKETFAEYTTNRRMVKNGQSASSFIESMHKQIKSAFDSECALLKDYKASMTDQKDKALEPWDVGYWSEQHQKEHYQFDEEALRPYFPIDKVIDGLFSICEKLFNLSIESVEAIYIDPKASNGVASNPKQLPEVWHPDVKLYNLYDKQTHALLGSFYADWHPRESKRSGAWMNYLRTGSRTGTHTPHLGLICGNLTPALKDTPSLLTHHEVETIFHEFGHLLHHLCGTVEVPSLNGVNVAWDFVELPSQIMENWCWERESLDLFARHYQTDEPIPEALFEKMQACKNHFKAMGTMRQLSLAKLDLDLHRDWVLDHSQAIDNYLKDRLKDYHFNFSTPTRPIVCNFGHLFSSTTGYAAGYYSYKWAEVLDADAFTRFQNEGLLNSETGLAFRDTILAKGNSEDPYKLFQDFMGRKPSTDALLKRDGILA